MRLVKLYVFAFFCFIHWVAIFYTVSLSQALLVSGFFILFIGSGSSFFLLVLDSAYSSDSGVCVVSYTG